MLGAQQDLGGAVVLGDNLLGHVHSPVRLLHSEIDIKLEHNLVLLYVCGRHKYRNVREIFCC